jgi:hypothetical protein
MFCHLETKSIFPLANFLKTVQVKLICLVKDIYKLEKKYAPALDNYCQSCFVRNDFKKMKCVCKTQMMPPPDHQNSVDMHTSIMCINILQNIKAVGM